MPEWFFAAHPFVFTSGLNSCNRFSWVRLELVFNCKLLFSVFEIPFTLILAPSEEISAVFDKDIEELGFLEISIASFPSSVEEPKFAASFWSDFDKSLKSAGWTWPAIFFLLSLRPCSLWFSVLSTMLPSSRISSCFCKRSLDRCFAKSSFFIAWIREIKCCRGLRFNGVFVPGVLVRILFAFFSSAARGFEFVVIVGSCCMSFLNILSSNLTVCLSFLNFDTSAVCPRGSLYCLFTSSTRVSNSSSISRIEDLIFWLDCIMWLEASSLLCLGW